MSEALKTTLFAVAAVCMVVLAIITTPRIRSTEETDVVAKSLFPNFNDPSKVKRMRIITYDDSKGSASEFEVAQQDGVWTLPPFKGYPADAKQQIISAATSLSTMKVLGKKTDNVREHEELGVLEPDPSKEQSGRRGYGKLVIFEDESKKPIARLIIGKKDKPVQSDQLDGPQEQELRFVRVPGQDRVYRVAMSTSGLTNKFSDWIETDLLKINTWDITDVDLRDYSVTQAIDPSGKLLVGATKRADIDLGYDGQKSEWTLRKLLEYKDDKPEEVKLAPDEELNTARLNEMSRALDDLKIIDVARKPARMSANLKADKDLVADQAAVLDLLRHGFVPLRGKDDQVEVLSKDGEAVVSMKDGVEYVLRFGDIAGVDAVAGDESDDKEKSEAKSDDAEKKSDEEDLKEKEEDSGVKRYLLVMARFNPDLIPKPELQPLPEIKKAPQAAATSDSAAKKSDGKADDAGKKTANGKKSDSAKTDKDEKKDESAEPEDLEALEAERDMIEKENRRKEDAYKDKIKKGQQRAQELNARFADWYYVINDETYRKIHLSKADIIKKKPAEGDEKSVAPANPFDRLQSGKK